MKTIKVKINKLPASYGVQTPPNNTVAYPGNGFPNYGNEMEIQLNRNLGPTSKENATLEAELGETVVTNLQQEGIPEFYKIGGKRHSKGGTPLNLPPDSFIFSRDKSMNIDDPGILKMFGKTSSKGMTPADLSKTYDLNVYREILANPFTDKYQKDTAELMIKNYNLKLGALALVQESKKGFNRGIPAIAIPYMESQGINPDELLLGANPPTGEQLSQFKDGGSPQAKRKVKILSMPKFQHGAEVKGIDPKKVEVSTQPTKKWDTKKPGYKQSDVQAGDYILQDNGTYKRVKGAKSRRATTQYGDDRLGKYQNDYSLLVEKFEDPKFKEAFLNNYYTELKQTKPNPRTNFTQQHIDEALAMKPKEIIDTFLYKQQVNFGLHNKIGNLGKYDPNDKWDRKRIMAENEIKKLNYKSFSIPQTASFQAGYAGFAKLLEDPKFTDLNQTFKLAQEGSRDEPGAGTGNKGISDVDGFDANTTSGQLVVPIDSELDLEDVQNITSDNSNGTPGIKHLEDDTYVAPAKWWTQDLVNMTGALGDLYSAKKYEPWQATPQYNEAEPTFTDFRGTAARIGSQGAGLAQNAATFAGPQAYGAIAANIQKGMVDPILQTQEAENRTNVGVTNEFEQFNTNTKNQYDMTKAGLDTQLYDKSVITNQQFDNTKRALRQNVRNTFNQAWTNKGQTQAMNTLYPQYSVDPTTGYRVFGNPKKIEANDDYLKTIETKVAAMKNAHPDWSDDLIRSIIKLDKGIPDNDYPVGVNPQNVIAEPPSYPSK